MFSLSFLLFYIGLTSNHADERVADVFNVFNEKDAEERVEELNEKDRSVETAALTNAERLSCPMQEVSKTNGSVKKSHVKKQNHRHSSLLQQVPYSFQMLVLFLILSMSKLVHGAASTLPGIGSDSDVFSLETCQGGVVSEQSVDSTSPALCMGIKETNEKEIQRLLNQGTCYCKTSTVDFDFDSFLFQTCFIAIVSYLFYLKYPTN